jgi:hypothetical protein
LVTGRKGRELDWDALFARFPGRTQDSISKQIHAHGMSLSRVWTAEENAVIDNGWGYWSRGTLRRRLPGRTWGAIYDHATKDLGKTLGAPQGMVSVKDLSEDPVWGYDYYATLRIMEASGVQVRVLHYDRDSGGCGVRYVDRDDAIAAAYEWEKAKAQAVAGKESVREAATRLHLRPSTLRGWLTDAGVLPPASRQNARPFHAEPEVYDRIVARYRTRPCSVPVPMQVAR